MISGEKLLSAIGVYKQDLSEVLGKLLAEGAFEQSLGPLLIVLLDLRQRIVEELLLLVVKSVPRVDGVADVRKVHKRVKMALQLVILKKDLLRLVIAFGGFKSCGKLAYALFARLHIGAAVRHLSELHLFHPFSASL